MNIYITGLGSGYEVEHLVRLFYPMAITGLKTSSRPMKSRRKLSVCYLSVIGRSMLCCRTPVRSDTSRLKYFYP